MQQPIDRELPNGTVCAVPYKNLAIRQTDILRTVKQRWTIVIEVISMSWLLRRDAGPVRCL